MWALRLRSIDALVIEHRDSCRRPEHKGHENMKRHQLMIGAAIALLATVVTSVSSLRAQEGAAAATAPPAEPVTPATPRQGPPQRPVDPRVQVRSYEFEDTHEQMPYALYVSSKVKPNKKSPLIVTLHGLGGTHTTMMRSNALDLAES